MLITTQFRSHLHGLCTVTAEPDCSRSNLPSWKNARAFDRNGHPVAVDLAALEALDIAWSGELRIEADDEFGGADGVLEVL